MSGKRTLSLVLVGIFAVLGTATAGSDEDTESTPEAVTAAAPPAADPLAAPAAIPSGAFTSGNVHCNSPDLGMCEELSSLGASNPGARDNCNMVGGQWGTGPCPTENALGHCDTLGGMGSRNHYYQSDLFASAAAAQAACTDPVFRGTWTAAH